MQKHLYSLLIIVFVVITGCGDDNSTGVDEGEAPAIPGIQNAHPDFSFFNENSATEGDTAFSRAKLQITTSANLLLSFGQVYNQYLQSAREHNADYNDDTWSWSFSDAYQGTSLEIEITAQESNDSIEWAMFWTGNDSNGNNIENYRIIEGTVRKDGSEGNWTINALSNEEIPVYTSSWTTTSDTEGTKTLEIFKEDGSTAYTIYYEKDEPEFSMTFTYSDEQEDVIIFWNEDTGTGHLIDGGNQQCWNENLEDIACE